MRIAMIGHKTFPSRSGGVEVVVSELSTRLAARNHDVTVYNRGTKGKEKEYNKVHIRHAFTFRTGGSDAMVASFTATFAAVFRKYDIIHFHALGPSAMLPLAKLFRKKTVATVHGLDWQRAKWGGFATRYLKYGEKMIARKADKVIVLSEAVKEYFKETYGRDTILINNAVVPVEAEEPEIIKERFGLEKDGYVLYLARIVPEKRLDLLIEAFCAANIGKKLAIAGEIPDNEFGNKIREMIAGKDDIVPIGFVEGRLLRELYTNCSLYVLPSSIEGMALTLLEAMSAGCKCLVSDIPENLRVIENFGTSFKTEDKDSLTEMLRESLDRVQTEEEKQQQKDLVAKKYSYDAMVDSTLSVYNELLADSKKGGKGNEG